MKRVLILFLFLGFTSVAHATFSPAQIESVPEPTNLLLLGTGLFVAARKMRP